MDKETNSEATETHIKKGLVYSSMRRKEINLKKGDLIKFLTTEIANLFRDNLVSIVLFGSRARENYGKISDFDLIIVLEKENGFNLSKLRKKFLLNFKKKLDLHVFTKQEVIENFENYTPIFVSLLLGKKILFDKKMFFKEQFNNFIKKMIDIDIKYCEGNKIWEMQKIARSLETSH